MRVDTGRLLALTIRMTVAMTLMPEVSYTGAMRRLAGHLADVPFDRDWHVPTSGVATEWRGKVPPAVMQELFWLAAGSPAGAASDGDDDDGPVLALGGMPVCGIDGMLVALADTPANRAMFGCTGTRHQKGPGSAPFPQLLAVVVTARAGRATLGAITGKARAGEQTLLARLIRAADRSGECGRRFSRGSGPELEGSESYLDYGAARAAGRRDDCEAGAAAESRRYSYRWRQLECTKIRCAGTTK